MIRHFLFHFPPLFNPHPNGSNNYQGDSVFPDYLAYHQDQSSEGEKVYLQDHLNKHYSNFQEDSQDVAKEIAFDQNHNIRHMNPVEQLEELSFPC